jgi:hypothetical protein
MAGDDIPRPWWLARPGMPRRFQLMLLLLLVLGAFGLIAGLVARSAGQDVANSMLVGVIAAFGLEIILFAIPIRMSRERTFRLQATPEQVFALATDPVSLELNPLRPRLVKSSGAPGEVGSSNTLVASGWKAVTTVVGSRPPHEIVTETRSGLQRVTTTARYRAVGNETEVWVQRRIRVQLAAWLLLPVYRSEVDYVLAESERRLRQHFAKET